MTQIILQIAINLPPPNSFALSRTHFVFISMKIYGENEKDLSGRNCLIFHLNFCIRKIFPINRKMRRKILFIHFAVRYQICDRGKLENYDLSSLLSK